MLRKRKTLEIEQNLQKRVLWPLGIILAISFATFLFISHYYMELSLGKTQEAQLQALTSRYHNYMQERSGLMRSLMQQLGRDSELIAALDRRDREFLLRHSTPLFNELLTEQHITHFYFHTPDGTNLLRVHKPERHGDLIKRVTMHLAQRNNVISDGIELGPLGTFTLRVVMPLHSQNRLIGYIELGQDIDPILDHLASDGSDKLVILIQKKFLKREAWIEGRSMLGEYEPWELLPEHVVGGFTNSAIIAILPQLATPEALERSTPLEINLGGKIYRGRFLNMMDAAGRSVGAMLALQDVDAILKDHEASIWLITLFCIFIGSVLFMIIATILGRVELNLRRINEQLADEQSEDSETPPS